METLLLTFQPCSVCLSAHVTLKEERIYTLCWNLACSNNSVLAEMSCSYDAITVFPIRSFIHDTLSQYQHWPTRWFEFIYMNSFCHCAHDMMKCAGAWWHTFIHTYIWGKEAFFSPLCIVKTCITHGWKSQQCSENGWVQRTSYSLMVPVQLQPSLMQTASRASTSRLAALSGKACGILQTRR